MASSLVDLNDLYQFLNFLINKFLGTFYAPEQMDLLVDRAQMAVYNDYYSEFGKSQQLNDSLAPFKRTFVFTQSSSPGGLITPPQDYYNLLSVIPTIFNSITSQPQDVPCPILNEDEIVGRENSQIIPLNTSNPFGVIMQNWTVQLYPKIPQAGTVFYLCRPQTPVYNYCIVSGRVIVYDANLSTQLEWADKDVGKIIIVALGFMGVNLRENEIVGWADAKEQRMLMTKDKA
jgi:hypothetical protein